MRIVILGANGQVGAEVCLKLAGMAGLDLVPVSRTRIGSAFLRSRGVAVWHGDPAKADDARAMFAGADLIANFALAGGAGKVGRLANQALIDATIDHSSAEARIILFSTLAVHGNWGADGRAAKNPYGDLKLDKERHFERRMHGRQGWVLRLGHVCGAEQNLAQALQDEIRAGPVRLPEPNRASNVTHVDAICEAIIAIAEGRTTGPGRYDLVNTPQWSWAEVYRHEAKAIGAELTMIATGEPPATARQGLKSAAFGLIGKLGLRNRLERLLPLLPASQADRIRADYMVTRTAREIAELSGAPRPVNQAAWWPALELSPLGGTRDTRDLINGRAFAPGVGRPQWPADLQSQHAG